MKKHLFLFVVALSASAIQAQNNDMYSIMHREWAGHLYGDNGLMQQRDGDFIIDNLVVEDLGNDILPLGTIFYKISPTTLTITDSLLIADTTMAYYNSHQNPNGEGNIRTLFEYHEDCDSCFLRISHFPDNDLHNNPNEDIVVPVCEGYSTGAVSMVDCKGDLILQYYKQIDALHHNAYAARLGIDGTLKHQAIVFENEIQGAGRLQMLKEAPLQYFQWGFSGTSTGSWDNITIYVLDSLFHKNPIVISSSLGNKEYLYIDGDTEVIPIGGDNVLLATKYAYEVNPSHPWENEYGVVVAKFDLRTLQLKGHIVFDDYPGNLAMGQCLGIKMMTDGTVYLLYKEEGYPEDSFVAVKMDTDLNVDWKRFCKTDNIVVFAPLEYPVLYKDEQGEEKGIAWIGNGIKMVSNNYGELFFLFNHEGPVNGVKEGCIEVRPYCYYPNPAKEQLHMQFSPDVQPAQVELYDLQGCLVRTQSKAFGSMDMSQLPAGTYTMRVTFEDGKSYSDKIMKE